MPDPLMFLVVDDDVVFQRQCDKFGPAEFPGADWRLAKGLSQAILASAFVENPVVLLSIESVTSDEIGELAAAMGEKASRIFPLYFDGRRQSDAVALAGRLGSVPIKKGRRFESIARSIRRHLEFLESPPPMEEAAVAERD